MQERLQVMEKAVENATKDPKHASMFVDRKIALEMLMVEDNLSMVLAPFLHGNRYGCTLIMPNFLFGLSVTRTMCCMCNVVLRSTEKSGSQFHAFAPCTKQLAATLLQQWPAPSL